MKLLTTFQFNTKAAIDLPKQVTARVKGFQEYSWFTYTGNPLKLRFRNSLELVLKDRGLFGVRYSSNKKDKRLVVADPLAGLTKVMLLTPELETHLFKYHRAIDQRKAEQAYEETMTTSMSAQSDLPSVEPKLAPNSKKLAVLLEEHGFVISLENCADYGKTRNAYSGSLSAKETCSLVKSIAGIPRDSRQFKGHINFTDASAGGDNLVQVGLYKGKTLVTLALR